jgi:3-isopropylmalate/(R)-2-methylmalate dehydratase small subunit
MIEGRAVVLGDDVNTDNILPGAYLNLTDPADLGEHLLETYPGDVAQRIRPGDILVAGENFGMGSSREQAQIAILARGVQAIVAASFARIFLRNCINVGLPVAESREASAAIADGDIVRIDLPAGTIARRANRFAIPPQPAFVAEIVDAGGLVPWARARLHTEQGGIG